MKKLFALGWGDRFGQTLSDEEKLKYQLARVIEVQRGLFWLSGEFVDSWAQLSGRFRQTITSEIGLPAVGDWVLATHNPGDDRAMVHRVLPRKSQIVRKAAGDGMEAQVIATNIDTAFIVTSLNRDLNLRRLERYLTLVWESGAQPVILLTKSDLSEFVESSIEEVEAVAPLVPVHAISSVKGHGLELLAHYLAPGKTSVLIGSSGVGKSTLLNTLVGENVQRVLGVREDDDRGRHTTTHRELIVLPSGGLMIDTPGLRELQLWHGESGASAAFSDVESLGEKCRFRDCMHSSEPGCAILSALDSGALSFERWESYRKLQREIMYLESRKDKAALSEQKKKWKKAHKALKQMKR